MSREIVRIFYEIHLIVTNRLFTAETGNVRQSHAVCTGDDEQARTENAVSLPARHQMQLTKTVAAKPHCVGKDGSFVVYLYSDSAAQAAGRVTNRPRAHKFVNTDRETWVCLRTLSRLRVPTTESAPRRMTFKNVDCEPGLFFIDRDVMVGRSRCAVGTPRRGATTVSWFVLGYLQRIEGLNWPFS